MRRPGMPPVVEAAGWLGAVGLAVWAQTRFASGQIVPAAFAALGAIGLLAVVSGPWWRWREKLKTGDEAPSDGMPLGLEFALVALVFAWAAAVRFWGLTEYPPYIFVDESHRAMEAVRAASGDWVSPWVVAWWSVPSLYFYYASWFARWFGWTELAIRVPCAVSGTLTVWLFYPLARRLFGPRWAILVTFLFASSRWHFNVSRWGGEEVAMPMFWVACLLGVAVAFRCRPWWVVWRRRDPDAEEPVGYSWRRLVPAALGGAGLGLVLYTYAAARLLPLALAGFFAHQVVFRWRFFRHHFLSAVVVVVVSFAAFAPLGRLYLREPFHLTRRMQEVSIFPELRGEEGLAPLWRNIGAHVAMFHAKGDRNARHNLPGMPMLDPVTGVLFLLGLGVMLGRIHEPASALALFALVGGMAAGILTRSDQAPQTFRAVATVVGVYLAIGLGLSRLSAVLARLKHSPIPRLVLFVLVAFAALWAAQREVRVYFGKQMRDPAVMVGFNSVMTVASREVRDAFRENPRRQVYVWGDLHGWSTLQFFEMDKFHGGPNERLLQPFDPTSHLPILATESRPVSVFLRPQQSEQRRQVSRYYPDAEWQMRRVEGVAGVAYMRCDISSATLESHRGLEAIYQPVAEGPPIEVRDRTIGFLWKKPEELPESVRQGFDARWEGCLAVRRTRKARVTFAALSGGRSVPAPGSVWIDDREVYRFDGATSGSASQPVTREVSLAPGAHGLVVRARWCPGDALDVTLLVGDANGPAGPVGAEDLFDYRIPTNGLIATYYRGVEWKGEPLFERRERAIGADPDVLSPFSVEWRGVIRIPKSGVYRFEPNSDDACQVFVNGDKVGWDPGPGRGMRGAAPVALDAGYHDIRITYWDQGGGRNLTVWFFPPGQGRRPLPGDLLLPCEP